MRGGGVGGVTQTYDFHIHISHTKAIFLLLDYHNALDHLKILMGTAHIVYFSISCIEMTTNTFAQIHFIRPVFFLICLTIYSRTFFERGIVANRIKVSY